MTYRTLYREWRPQSFDDVVGQEHVCRILTNALATGRVAHAYLFCGPRGTGKTSTAKILAKALNCVHGPTPEPCNECSPCQRITSGDFLDVLEIDGASNRGIDEVRQLREKVQLAPAEGRYKVYIIDEVHMLTTEAFNALLKTLEEPPARVVFIFATTEAHKIPLTILSRCQRLDFHRLPLGVIARRLEEVAASQGVEIEERTLFLLAKKAEGSLRDALSFLDQCISLGGKKIDHEEVLAVLGVAAGEALAGIVTALAGGDVAGLLLAINRLLDRGRDPRQLVRDLIGYFRNLLVVKVCQDPGGLVEVTAGEAEMLTQQAPYFSREQLLQLIELLAQTEGEVRLSSQPRILLEVMAVRMVNTLDKRDITAVPPAPEPAGPPPAVPQGSDAPAPRRRKTGRKAAKEGGNAAERGPDLTLERVREGWPQFLAELRKNLVPAVPLLQDGEPVQLEGSRLTLAFAHEVCKEKVGKKYRDQLEGVLKQVFGRELKIYCILKEETGGGEEKGVSLVQEVMDLFGPDLVEEKEGTPEF